jgi:hypothetical protein
MKQIQRYIVDQGEGNLLASNVGDLCEWSDVEALQKECNELRAKALAAVWMLVQEGVNLTDDLQALHEEVREVLLGKDKQTIATLRDELANERALRRRMEHPLRPGVNGVYGIKDGKYEGMRSVLMITKMGHAPNGGLEIEVQLP